METPGLETVLATLARVTLRRFDFDIILETRAALPGFIGSTVRGSLGHALRYVSCDMDRGQDCDTCPKATACPYVYLFVSPIDHDNPLLPGRNRAPHPLVLDVPLDHPRDLEPWSHIRFGVTLVGQRATTLLPFLVAAVRHMARRGLGRRRSQEDGMPMGRGRLTRVTTDGLDLYDPMRDRLDAPPEAKPCVAPDQAWPQEPLELTIETRTPLSLRKDGQDLGEPSVRDLILAILRRMDLLDRMLGGPGMGFPWGPLLDLAGSVLVLDRDLTQRWWSRWSERQGRRIRQGGVLARWRLGDVDPRLLPIFAAGERVGIGRGTVFGLGKIEVRRG